MRIGSCTAALLMIAAGLGCQGRMNRPDPAVTVQGCISSSSGQFQLTDGFGHQYELSGNLSQVRQNVGHELLIHGALVKSKESPQGHPEATNGVHSQIDVTEATVARDSCNQQNH